MLETCREMKLINKYTKKCVKLVISKNQLSQLFVWLDGWLVGQLVSWPVSQLVSGYKIADSADGTSEERKKE